MWERLRQFRLTPAGGLVTMLLVASVVVLVVGPRHDRQAALIVLVVVLVLVVGQAAGVRGRGTLSSPTLEQRRADFHAQHRDPGESASLDPAEQERLWRRERERYRSGD